MENEEMERVSLYKLPKSIIETRMSEEVEENAQVWIEDGEGVKPVKILALIKETEDYYIIAIKEGAQ